MCCTQQHRFVASEVVLAGVHVHGLSPRQTPWNHVHRQKRDVCVHAGFHVFGMTEGVGDACKVGSCCNAFNAWKTNAYDVAASQGFGTVNDVGTCVGVVLIVVVGCNACTGFYEDLKSSPCEFLHA